MSGTVLVGAGRDIQRESDDAFMRAIAGLPGRMASRLKFMTREHHLVRNFVVGEMPRQSRSLSPRYIAKATGLSQRNVSDILIELEKNLFFLVRDSNGNVDWAFPVTTTVTPHRLAFSTGERTFGA